jgi:hypothetical protein
MTDEIEAILSRIEGDVALIRKMIVTELSLSSNPNIPVLKKSYTKKVAEQAKLDIEAAFRRGLISYDKKRGMKMQVTKATVGWSPLN